MNSEELRKSVSSSLKKKKSGTKVYLLGDPDVGSLVKYVIPTSMPSLNKIIGGGIPCGRVTEIYGEESNGKSTLVADIMASVQRMGGIAVIVDSEQVFHPDRATALGVNVKDIVYFDAVTAEAAFEAIETVLEQLQDYDNQILIVWDSIGASTTNAELEGEMQDQQMGVKARVLNKGIRRMLGKITQNVAVVFVNQIRSKIGGMGYGPQQEGTGGIALRYAASLRLQLKYVGKIVVDEKQIGIQCKATTLKNKVCPPQKSSTFSIFFDGRVEDSDFLLDLLIKTDLIQQSGAWYQYKDQKKFMRKEFKNILPILEADGVINQALDSL